MLIETLQIPISRTEWSPCWRIISSRFPPVDLFERVASAEDYESILEIESLTNPRIRNEKGEISLVSPEDSVFGPEASLIMAPFTHHHPDGSRFSNGTYGLYYASSSLETAIAETKYHREKFLRDFNSEKTELDMRVLLADLKADLHDITGMRDVVPQIYHHTNYSTSQTLGQKLRKDGSNGILYDSVRNPEGKCVGIFKPRTLSNCRQERHLCYVWNSKEISLIYRKSELKD